MDQSGSAREGEKSVDPGRILKTEPTGFAHEKDVGCDGKKGVRSFGSNRRMEFHLLRWRRMQRSRVGTEEGGNWFWVNSSRHSRGDIILVVGYNFVAFSEETQTWYVIWGVIRV